MRQESEDHQNIFDVEEKIGRKCGWQIIAKLKEPYKNEDEYARKFLKMHQEFLSDVYQKNSVS